MKTSQFSWQGLARPFFVLAPMEDVTDTVFRQILSEIGGISVFFTEFTNCEGILSSQGSRIVNYRLEFTDSERPIIAQLWGNKPESFFAASQLIASRGFDGIDINMGCPEKSVLKQHCGAYLISDKNLSAEIIHAVKDGSHGLPVSVKTRIGLKTRETENWTAHLLNQNIDALTVHGRTASELSQVAACWEDIQIAVQIRNSLKKNTVIIGNGDITNREDGLRHVQSYQVDGVMIGRGIFHNPWAFSDSSDLARSPAERLELLTKHIQLFTRVWGNRKPYKVLKKFYKMYCSGFPGANDMRTKLMETNSPESALLLLQAQVHKN